MTIALFWTLLWHRIVTGYTAPVDFSLIYNFTPSQGPPSTLGAIHNVIIRNFVLLVFYILLALAPGGFLYLLWMLLRSFGPINRLLKTIKNGLLCLIQNVSRVFTKFAESRAAPAWIQVSINAFLKLCKPFSLCRHSACWTIIQVNLSAALRYTCWFTPVRQLARPYQLSTFLDARSGCGITARPPRLENSFC